MNEKKYLSPLDDSDFDFDLDALVREVIAQRYDHKAPAPPTPDYSIKVGGKGIALPGSLIGVYGPPKSRKSSFMGMIAAAALSRDGVYGNISTKINGDILWFDTEQNQTEVKYFQDNVVRMANIQDTQDDDDYVYSRYYAMKLRPYDELQRLAIIDRILTNEETFNNVGMLVLDGVADLLYNVNEIEASKKLVTRLTYWADLKQIPLFVALHTNKDGKDATGSLGGFINKKASYTIKCEPEYDNGPSTVRPYFTRNGQNFEPFMITNMSDDEPYPGMPKFYEGPGGFLVDTKKTKSRSNQNYDFMDAVEPEKKDLKAIIANI